MHNKLPAYFFFIKFFNKEHIRKLDKKIAIIYRNYSIVHNKKTILKIKKTCKECGKKFYLSNNLKLAMNLDLDGVYLPSFNTKLNLAQINVKEKFSIIGSAHSIKEIRIKEKQGVRCIFLSPIFKNKKKINYLGIYRFNYLSKLTDRKIIALGGINEINIKKLRFLKCNGYASITYLRNKKQIKLI